MQTSPIGIMDGVVTLDGNYTIILQNNTSGGVTITDIKFDDQNATQNFFLDVGDEKKITIDTTHTCANVGAQRTIDVTISYNTNYGIPHKIGIEDATFGCEASS